MYVRKRVICEWCRWNYEKLRPWTNFTASRSWRKYLFTIVCRVWVQFYGICTRWTIFLLIWLVKTATECVSLVPRRKGMDFYRASNSSSWGAAVEGAVCRGCGASNSSSWGAAVEGAVCRGCILPVLLINTLLTYSTLLIIGEGTPHRAIWFCFGIRLIFLPSLETLPPPSVSNNMSSLLE
jgi:hypothetical protein